ncbi:MAG TPA: NAD(P)H-dependent oxidoreductase [Miltoncostaeaceae bacterium]|nr:NAD(P)H-dependent oxidoreductase [Miltoncostaeaceae bacterium]
MRVLIVYAHPEPGSFCHAVLEQVERGLRDGGHAVAVIDLHAIGFDPVFRRRDAYQFMHPTLPDEMVEGPELRQAILERAGGPLRRRVAARWMGTKTNREIVRALGRRTPRDVRRHQEAVARAEGLVFIAPVFWMGLPAILKGWFERVFAYGFAYTLDSAGWKGDLAGRVPLLTQEKGLVITPTFFTEEEYDTGWREAMDTIVCEWGLEMAGVKKAEHVYLYAVLAVDAATRAGYLDLAYRLGRDFADARGAGDTTAT